MARLDKYGVGHLLHTFVPILFFFSLVGKNTDHAACRRSPSIS
ncbi:hypothetical protein I656_02075 [Geobacillus sp. WSUCF1]|nr:hypothetical protein I656_02075 [Geobacillus sp. WSUCF1]